MVSFRSGLLSCLLATTSYAFAVKPISQSPAFTHGSHGATRVPVNLSMPGGSQAVPDLKVRLIVFDHKQFQHQYILIFAVSLLLMNRHLLLSTMEP